MHQAARPALAVVSGGSGGVGFAIASALCRSGYGVAGLGRDGTAAADAARRLPSEFVASNGRSSPHIGALYIFANAPRAN